MRKVIVDQIEALAELAERAGVEPGVFNLVTGRASTVVPPWTDDSRVRALSFTGSTEIGRLLYRQSSDTVKRLVLELARNVYINGECIRLDGAIRLAPR